MSTTIHDTNPPIRPSSRGEPAWEIATLFSIQGTTFKAGEAPAGD